MPGPINTKKAQQQAAAAPAAAPQAAAGALDAEWGDEGDAAAAGTAAPEVTGNATVTIAKDAAELAPAAPAAAEEAAAPVVEAEATPVAATEVAITLTADSAEGQVVTLGANFKTALHLVLVAADKSIADQGRATLPPLDQPFFAKGEKRGIAVAVIKGFAENFQSAFDRNLLVVGGHDQIVAVANKVASVAGGNLSRAVLQDVAQHVTAEYVNSVLGDGRIAEGGEVTLQDVSELLAATIGYEARVQQSTVLQPGGIEDTTFVVTVRIEVPSLIDAKDIFAAHKAVETALTAKQGEFNIENLRLSWIVGDRALRHANNLTLLSLLQGHLDAKVDYYQVALTADMQAALDAGEQVPLSQHWTYFPLDDQESILQLAAASNTNALTGSFIATCPYAGIGYEE